MFAKLSERLYPNLSSIERRHKINTFILSVLGVIILIGAVVFLILMVSGIDFRRAGPG